MSADDGAPGWDAIEQRLQRLYPDQGPVHHAPLLTPGLGGALQGISAYRQPTYWHLITFGLSELYAKESDDPAASGFGYELTIRVPTDGQTGPPGWALTLLEKIAQAQRQGHDFALEHRLSVGGPITGRTDCRLNAIAFADDPELGRIDTPNGALSFLQIVGITDEELAEMRASSTNQILARISVSNPLLITDPSR